MSPEKWNFSFYPRAKHPFVVLNTSKLCYSIIQQLSQPTPKPILNPYIGKIFLSLLTKLKNWAGVVSSKVVRLRKNQFDHLFNDFIYWINISLIGLSQKFSEHRQVQLIELVFWSHIKDIFRAIFIIQNLHEIKYHRTVLYFKLTISSINRPFFVNPFFVDSSKTTASVLAFLSVLPSWPSCLGRLPSQSHKFMNLFNMNI